MTDDDLAPATLWACRDDRPVYIPAAACEQCGALVPTEHIKLHLQWHRRVELHLHSHRRVD